jgi:lipid-A-disaccharide synthase
MTAKTIAIIAGEESGDLLGADLVQGLRVRLGDQLNLIGVGGDHLQSEGLKSLIEPSEIALMGITAILARLPQLLGQIRNVADKIIAAKPDVLIIIDSPEFTHRVARKVRAALPQLPIINYVCPSVWAWRPKRAKAMTAYINEVLCILPFEPAALQLLGGPSGTFVGHRLTSDPDILRVLGERQQKNQWTGQLMLLPGSRSGEIARLLPDMLETARLMLANGTVENVVLPTLERHKARIDAAIALAKVPCMVVTGVVDKWAAFASADAALAASGTVSLELALCNVPHASVYRFDFLAKHVIARSFIAWSANLPNLIADRVVVPESYNNFFRPDTHSRLMTGLIEPAGRVQRAQLDGFERVRRAMQTHRPAGEIAAERVLNYLG